MLVIPVIGPIVTVSVKLHPNAKYETLRKLVEPYLEGDKLAHRAVIYEGERRDLIVGEMACDARNHAIRNVRATDILNTHARLLHPEMQDYLLPFVGGVAVLFPDARVWF